MWCVGRCVECGVHVYGKGKGLCGCVGVECVRGTRVSNSVVSD